MPAIAIASRPPPKQRRRLRALGTIALAALLIHAAVLGRLQWTWPGAATSLRPAGAVQVRALTAAPAGALSDESGAPPPAPMPAQAFTDDAGRAARAPPAPALRTPSRPPRAVASREQPSARPAPSDAPRDPVIAPSSESPSTRDPAAAAAPPSSGGPTPPTTSAGAPTDAPIPTYRTRFPPPATLHYDLARGAQTGVAELQWRPTADGYTLRLAADIGARAFLTQASQGDFDAAGLAPLRHTDLRARRGALATNFQRDAGRISFSGSSRQLPLVSGGQDRLSWMIQLAAVLAAEPGRGAPGQVVAVPVAGLRGELSVWTFTSHGLSEVSTDVGPTEVLRMVRGSQGPYDGSAEVWLDPARHHLPVRLLLQPGGSAPPLELVLRSLDIEP